MLPKSKRLRKFVNGITTTVEEYHKNNFNNPIIYDGVLSIQQMGL
jgi:hypothetical protein